MNIPEWVTLIISFILLPVLAQLFKLLAAKYGAELGRLWTTIIVFVLSLAIAFVVMAPQLPSCTDVAQCITSYLTIAGALTGFATLLYNVILERLFVKIGFKAEVKAPTIGSGDVR